MNLARKYEITLIEPQIIKIIAFENVEIELEDVLEMKQICLNLAEGLKYAVLVDAKNNFLVSSEARIKLSSKEYTEDRIATAFVTESLANKLIGNFFIKFNKPASPTKLFSEENTALIWLKEQLPQISKTF